MAFQWLRNLINSVRGIYPEAPLQKVVSSAKTQTHEIAIPPTPVGRETLVIHSSSQRSPSQIRGSFQEVYNLFQHLIGENDEQRLFNQITNNNYAITKQLVDATLDNPVISNEWKIWIFASRIQHLAFSSDFLLTPENKIEVIALINKTKEFAIDFLKTEVNNPDAISFILNKENRKNESQLRIKTFCMASILAACNTEKIKTDDKELDARLQTIGMALTQAQVKFKKSGPDEAYGGLIFVLPEDYKSPPSSLVLNVFHEIEHDPIISKYNLSYSPLNGGAISEFRCDLGGFKNTAKHLDSSPERLNLSRLEYKFQERYDLVYNKSDGYNCCKYAVARGFFESILKGWEENGSTQISLIELCDELEKGTDKVLKKHFESNTINHLSFSQFAEELVYETNSFLVEKGLSLEIQHPEKQLTSEMFRDKMKYINTTDLFGIYFIDGKPIPEDALIQTIQEMHFIASVPMIKMNKVN